MTLLKQNGLPACLLALTLSPHASAALFDRGNGMIYDSDLNITWLADANYFKTQADADPTLINEIIAAVPTIYSTPNVLPESVLTPRVESGSP